MSTLICCKYRDGQFVFSSFFFFNDTATTEIYTLSLHDALPISSRVILTHRHPDHLGGVSQLRARFRGLHVSKMIVRDRSEEHTSELQSQSNLVCRLLLEKKKKNVNFTLLCHTIRPLPCFYTAIA